MTSPSPYPPRKPCEKCGKQHPLDWIHKDEKRCYDCGRVLPKSDFDQHHVYCRGCAAKLEAVR